MEWSHALELSLVHGFPRKLNHFVLTTSPHPNRVDHPCVPRSGPTGTGKTVNVVQYLQTGVSDSFVPLCLTFSAQTSANQTQARALHVRVRSAQQVLHISTEQWCIRTTLETIYAQICACQHQQDRGPSWSVVPTHSKRFRRIGLHFRHGLSLHDIALTLKYTLL